MFTSGSGQKRKKKFQFLDLQCASWRNELVLTWIAEGCLAKVTILSSSLSAYTIKSFLSIWPKHPNIGQRYVLVFRSKAPNFTYRLIFPCETKNTFSSKNQDSDWLWVSVNSIGKVYDGYIKYLELNSRLHQKLIDILVWW